MAEVHIKNVTKSFGDHVAVDGLDLHIADGEFVVLLGPTGAGKTTTLRLIAGLERPDSGMIEIGGHNATTLSPAERDTAFVFQQYSLYPHLSVFDNLAFPLRSPARKMPEDQIRRRVEEVAKMVRIHHKLANRSTKLSGGEMQRVAIGRALVRKPSIYLMDEPLSSLDAKLRGDLRLELKRIQTELGATMLYVTHDQIEAMTMADRIGILTEGVLVQIGSPRTIYSEPANLHVAARLGQPAINLLPTGLLPDGGAPAGTKTIGARTEHLSIAKAANGHADGIVDWVEHLGDQNHLHVTVGTKKLVTLTDPDTDLAQGDKVVIRYRAPLYFGADGQRLM
ncbi:MULTISPECIES: ABC transporter ATP-binding protein [unclassified Mesorhizobium]|uniref:ABC transporter ATP-binding protein n=1 Tax=unclassified Mesorhizobium TaxID=325217 RepID=UPI000FCBD867|nr:MULTISPECIES: ABC transporter ATP-binding protein [unclassified Mesorhizobium]RUU85346.1 ABC transporter ATP-binding protein [Mesorhizobium sp. M7A.T.Ca.TU.009.01.1.2]RWO44505.1 MAG: ABC transporter ATP-binding protein [Mesorhizobium sp.]RUT81314.1 ABC transporter ATP-binding protein [Mesorhizobium sp. M7A.T.Ca.US.000.02.1.1]RUT91191.1 ABC transporter ATP-binding protein [Mesorhizobium sp. M7A.T.Ca.US.000.02.2.1]RUU02528.1 ABC transporter ATP-binding protein [Mesorhizobium sp. M7A.T.Ca.TU.0